MQKEDDTWSVFHTDARGDELLALRERIRRREGLSHFYNRSTLRFNANALDMP